jgi:hypothetical protein
VDIRPLTHSNKAGTLYYRDALVEQKIQSLDNLPDDEVLARAGNQDKDSPGYIQEEGLVYWIREYLHRGDSPRASELANILLLRCAKQIQLSLRKLGPDLAAQAEQDIVSDLFKDIVDLNSDRGDFLQVRFWHALKMRIIGAFNRYLRNSKRTEALVATHVDNEPYGDDSLAKAPDSYDVPVTGLSAEDRTLVKEALAAVDEPYRTAFILYYYYDWPSENKDPDVLTISSYFEKTPRTIRNWLTRAEEALREWRNEER